LLAQAGLVPKPPYAGTAPMRNGILGISIVPVMVLVVALLTSRADRLQKERALLDEPFEQAPQAVVLTSADERIVHVNREFTRLFGYTPQEAVGRRLADLIVPDEARAEEHRYAELVARGQRVDAEGVRHCKDGTRLPASILRVPVTLPGGRIASYAIYGDMTERKRAEAALPRPDGRTARLRAVRPRRTPVR
jgi:PAS domain S-box-containing protein